MRPNNGLPRIFPTTDIQLFFTMSKAKPFVKWVGGKGQLIEQLENLLPTDFYFQPDLMYVEPFVGGGAMLFYMLQKYDNIRHAVINDINPELTTSYLVIRNRVGELIRSLSEMEAVYYGITAEEERKAFYLRMRDRFNEKPASAVESTTLFIFLNRTCFNGLYRVNKKGLFNVPFGRYTQPRICDADTLEADSRILQRVTVMTGDFTQTLQYAQEPAFFYLDPPYRPLSQTSSFNSYAALPFDDREQVRLKLFCDCLQSRHIPFMLSNADCLGANGSDRFLDDLYAPYSIVRVWATRLVNANASKRGRLTEILVRNYAR